MKAGIAMLFASLFMAHTASAQIIGGGTTFTLTGVYWKTNSTTNVSARVDQYSTRLIGRLNGGPNLFDQTFAVAHSDPAVLAALTQITNTLTGAGAIGVSAPMLTSNLVMLVSTTSNTVQNGEAISDPIIGVKIYVGPWNIVVGDLGFCENYTFEPGSQYAIPMNLSGGNPQNFDVPASITDFDATSLYLVTNYQTVTITSNVLTTQVYELVGAAPSPLILECPTNIVLPVDPGGCSRTNVTYAVAFSGDGATLTQTEGLPSGATFLVGTTINTFVVTDSNGNSNSCSFSVKITGECVPGQVFSISTVYFDTIHTTNLSQQVDHFSTELIVRIKGGPILSDQVFPVADGDPAVLAAIAQATNTLTGDGAMPTAGPTVISNLVSLISSLTNSVQNARQTNAPITGTMHTIGPATILINDLGFCQSYTFAPVSSLTSSNYAIPVGAPGGTPFTVTAGFVDTDVRFLYLVDTFQTTTITSNYLTTRVLEVVGVLPPTITCSSNLVLAADPGGCSRTNVTYAVTFSGDGATLTQTAGLPSGSTFLKGTTTNSFTVTDTNGNSSSCSFTVTITGSCGGGVTTFSTATVFFETIHTTNLSQQVDQFSTRLIGRVAGVSTVFDQTFNVADSDPVVQAAIIQATSALTGAGAATVSGPTLTSNLLLLVSSSSNTVQNGWQTNAPIIGSRNTIGPGTIQVGELGFCQSYTYAPFFGVTNGNVVIRPGDPEALTGGWLTFALPVGLSGGNPQSFNVAAGDNDIQVRSLFLVDTFQATTTSNTYLTTRVLEVVGVLPPSITCSTNLVLATDPGQCSRSNVTYAVGFSGDGATLTQTAGLPSGSMFLKGTTTNRFTVTDTNGLSNNCSFTVTINDAQPPTIVCPANIVVNAAEGQANAGVGFPAPVVTDNCPGANAIFSPPSGSEFPLGTSTVTLSATDAAGNTNACTFTVTVNATLPGSLVAEFASSPMVLNRQTGLFEQSVRLKNLGGATVNASRVYVLNLPSTNSLYNRSGVATPVGAASPSPFVQYNLPLASGSNVVFLLEFYLPNLKAVTNHTLQAEVVGPASPPTLQSGAQAVPLTPGHNPLQLGDGRFLIEWAAIPGRAYLIQYSSDMTNWKTVVPSIVAPATAVQWIDDGPPKTETKPAQSGSRYYRVFLLPAN